MNNTEAHKVLRKLLAPRGTKRKTVYTVLNHVSRSGMSREISLYVAKNGDILDITHWVSRVLDRKRGNTGGVKIGGYGMDMGFALVYELGATLWRKGTNKPHSTRNGEPDREGGFAIDHRWL